MQKRDASATELDSGAFGSSEEQSGVRKTTGKTKRVRVIEHPTWLSNRDQDDLRRYYRNGGSSATTRSTTAACLAIIEQRSRIAIPCVRCGGDVEKGLGGTGFIDSETGLAPGFQPSPENNARAVELLGLLFGPDMVSSGPTEPAPAEPPELLPVAFGDQLCPECDGRCWIVGGAKPAKKPEPLFPAPPGSPFRVTRAAVEGLPNVWPMAAEDAPGGYEMSEQMHADLGLLARVSRRIRTLLEMTGGDAAVEALGCYFAPDGGTIAALWHLVPAGKKLLRNNPQKLHPSQLFQNQRNEQAEKHDPNRQLLFEAADKQSAKLFEHACELWNIAGPPPEDRAGKHLDAIHEALTSWGAAALRTLRDELERVDAGGAALQLPPGFVGPRGLGRPEFEHDPSDGSYLGAPIVYGRIPRDEIKTTIGPEWPAPTVEAIETFRAVLEEAEVFTRAALLGASVVMGAESEPEPDLSVAAMIRNWEAFAEANPLEAETPPQDAQEREAATARFSEAMLAYDSDTQTPCDDPTGGDK